MLSKAVESANKLGIHVNVGNILSSDIFYDDNNDSYLLWKKMGILAIEMEAAALYMNAARLGVKALCILTVSDNIITREETTAEERQTAFNKMMELSLDVV